MRSDEFTTPQLEWLNDQVGNCARKLNRIKLRMDAIKFESDDAVFKAMNDALDALFRACSESHELIKARRPSPADPYKPSGYQRQRIATIEHEQREQDQRQMGK